jgi:NhaP-type Na+/H+ and K+/H+ antiporter
MAAAFPLREDAASVTYDPGLHIVGGMTYFLSSALGLIVVSRRLAADPRFRHLAGYALAAGITGVALFVLMGVFVVPEDAPLHAWAGLAQRIVIVVVLFPCTVVIALRLLRVTRAEDASL